MATGIILIVLGGFGFVVAISLETEDASVMLIASTTAFVAGIGLVMMARRIAKLEKERERRIARLEEAALKGEGGGVLS